MKYEQYEFLVEATRLADTIDLDVSLWHANDDNETEEEALALREKLYSSLPRLDYVFPPGGDPGKLKADVFVDRCKKIEKILKKYHPNAKMHPSAQAPHEYRDWGEIFVNELATLPDEIDAVIMGPNHAFPIHELRKRIPAKYRSLIEQIAEISELPQNYFASISEICVRAKEYGNYELSLIPSQSKVKVLTDRALNEDALKYMMVVLDVVNKIGTDVSEIDLRYGAVAFRTKMDSFEAVE
jgi:hypothetical protein